VAMVSGFVICCNVDLYNLLIIEDICLTAVAELVFHEMCWQNWAVLWNISRICKLAGAKVYLMMIFYETK
jgi:hypothetical protein